MFPIPPMKNPGTEHKPKILFFPISNPARALLLLQTAAAYFTELAE